MLLLGVQVFVAPCVGMAQSAPANDAKALAVVDRAIDRMGGESALRGVKSVRMDVMTQWMRTNFADHPFADQPSYEHNIELRDYTTRSWRNTRDFLGGAGGSVDIVRDTVGARTLTVPGRPATTTPLNTAYVDERRELFAVATERMLLAARDAGGLGLLTDTLIDQVPHARVSATIDGLPSTLFFRRTDGLPAMMRFRADETNDFGLAPWGAMDVEYWYSNWARLAPGVMLPRQRDVRRVGRTYKRMTLVTASINAPAPADSFVIADSTVATFLATERRPMWRASLDTTKIIAENFVSFVPWVGTSGAVRIGGKWMLFESGQRDGATALIEQFFASRTPNAPLGGAIVANVATSNGGAVHIAKRKLPLYVAPGATRMVRTIVGAPAATAMTVVNTPRWVRIGTDSLWMEPVNLPDFGGTVFVYSPTLKWLYNPMIGRNTIQPEYDDVVSRLRARGMTVEWTGSARDIHAAAAPAVR